jgi:hypothetical protein
MSGGCDHERSDEERALDRLRVEVRRLTAEVDRLRQENVNDRGMHEAQLANATHERDEAREWVRRLTQERRVLTCAFCGAEYPPGTPESNHAALTAHVRVCPKHPMREVERERDAALNRVGMSEEEAQRVARACFAFNVGANQQDDPPTYGLTDTLIAAFRAISAGVRPPTEGGDWIEPLCEWWPGLARRALVATPLRRGLMLRKATRGSVEIGVVLGPSKFTADAVDVLIGWVTDPGVAGIATVSFSQIERGLWRVASEQDAATARSNLAVPERDRTGRILTAVDAVVLTEPLGEPLSLPIAQPWTEEAQRIVDTAPEDGT